MWPQEVLGLRRSRREVVGLAEGRVLEVGIGTGLNLPWYEKAAAVTGVDPDPHMLQRAEPRARAAAIPVELRLLSGEELPFEDATFDTVVATLTFCTIPDPLAAAREVRRVLRPGGSLRFLEHVRAPRARLARLQDLATPLWRRLCAGCHPNRDTLACFRQAGFAVAVTRTRNAGIVVLGVARPV
ncbi:MAG: class I SAM-dependent methyltransferase [Deltaproteobacteria bacterium]|nr:class I SAM-dependent methyltransferase [Deltaproteobacteria bacterium]